MAASISNIGKQIGGATRQMATGLGQIAVNEIKEIKKDAQEQVFSAEETPRENAPSIAQKIAEEGPPEIDVAKLRAWENSQIGILESRLQQIANSRKRAEQEKSQAISEQMRAASATTQGQEAPVAQGKISRAIGAAKKGLSTILGNKKAETKGGAKG